MLTDFQKMLTNRFQSAHILKSRAPRSLEAEQVPSAYSSETLLVSNVTMPRLNAHDLFSLYVPTCTSRLAGVVYKLIGDREPTVSVQNNCGRTYSVCKRQNLTDIDCGAAESESE
jgi:hypothetical protein